MLKKGKRLNSGIDGTAALWIKFNGMDCSLISERYLKFRRIDKNMYQSLRLNEMIDLIQTKKIKNISFRFKIMMLKIYDMESDSSSEEDDEEDIIYSEPLRRRFRRRRG